MKRYYLYRHIRLDKNEPFYIGVGRVLEKLQHSKSPNEVYKRAYTHVNRNQFWRNIVSKSEYEVEIMLESDDYNFIKQKEIEFIKLYGRRDLGLGTLCNLTDGGEGRSNFIVSNETKAKQSKAAKLSMVGKRKEECTERLKRINPIKGKFGKDHYRAIKVYQYSLDWEYINEFDSLSSASIFTNTQISHLSQCLNGKRTKTNGFRWSKEKI